MTQPRPKKGWFLFWLLGFGGLFVVAEGIALADDDPGDTLSESLSWLIDSMGPVGVIGFLGFFAWFIPHILRRRRGGGDPPEQI